MKTIKTGFVFFTLLSLIQFAVAETVSIGTDKSFPPYHDIDENGELIGFEVDLAREICQIAKLECEFKFQPFSTLLSSVRFKKYDVAMSAFADSVNRKRVVDFSVPYLDGGIKFEMNSRVVDVDKFCSECADILDMKKASDREKLISAMITSFAGKTVGFERNTIMDKFFENNPKLKEQIAVYYGSDPDDLGSKLVSGELAFAMGGNYDDKTKLIKRSRIKAYGAEFGYGTAIVIRKGDEALKQKFDNAIEKLRRDGTLKKLAEKWFEEDLSPKI